jgi:protein-tyrosine sulfotransferase
MSRERLEPIFIHGIMPRSGTNYLWDLLCMHPDCSAAREPIREDFLLQESDRLVAYADAVRGWWDPQWGPIPRDLMSQFYRSLGDGLISFLRVERDKRLVTKTPSVRHLGRFFTFFPEARLIILIRDGRSVVQSAMDSFGWELDRAAREWASAAEVIRRFEGRHRQLTDRYLKVRYEDLLEDLEGSMLGILSFLGLDRGSFDLQAARALPVRGSSFYFGRGRRSLHWEPVERGPDFSPKERWRAWDRGMHERFEWIAGEQLRRFGYGSVVAPVAGIRRVMRNRLLDVAWQGKRAARRAIYRTRVTVGPATRPLRELLGLATPRPSRRGEDAR